MTSETRFASIVLMGKIASGKGTQAAAILETFGGVLYSNGNKVRSAITEPTPFGERLRETYEGGYLIPEWIASYWMTHAIIAEHAAERIVFEAVAKKHDEAELFHEIHTWLDRPYLVFNLQVPDDVVRERSAARARDAVDTAEKVEKRLQEFAAHTQRSIDFFRDQGTLIDLDGTAPPEAVQADLFRHLREG